ncbi:MAG: hypothetical protein QXR09_03515 [Candidatus Aenigmatarchaeota archaeon]
MALVVRPREGREKVYLDALREELRKRGIICKELTQDVSVTYGSFTINLKEGTYIISSQTKPEVVELIGIELKNKGYNVLYLDALTLTLYILSQ